MQLLYWFEGIRTPFLDAFFSTLTHLGSETLFMVIAVSVFWCVSKYQGYYLMTVGFFGTILNQFLKLACRISRPWVRDPNFTIVEAARADAGGYSFPSGHTQSVTAALGCPARFTSKRWLRAVLIVLILLTSISRMYLGVHTPADVGFSLVVGVAMVFVFYPMFQKGESRPGFLYGMLAALTLCALANVLYVELFPWPADIEEENLVSGIKNAYLLLGSSNAMLVSAYWERTRVRFDVKAPLWAQILKVVLGLLGMVAIKTVLKPVLNALLAGHPIAHAIRYFAMVCFAVCIWPLTFPWFQKGCPMKAGARRALRCVVIVVLVLALLAGVLYWTVTRDTKTAPIATDGAQNPLITPLGTTMLSGHRAGGGVAPENTLMALKNCVESTVYALDIFEFDIHLTADDVPVLLHDETLDRTSDAASYFGETDVAVGEKTFEELKHLNMGETFVNEQGEKPYAGLRGDDIPEDLRIISLEEALSYLESAGSYSYIIEIKNSGERGYRAADILYDTLGRMGCLERTVVGTFHNEITAYMDTIYPDMPRSAGFDECVDFYIRSLLNWKEPEGGFRFVALQIPTTDYVVNLGTSRVINYAHRHGIATQYWTINDPAEMVRLQSIGADAVMTDVPDEAVSALVQP